MTGWSPDSQVPAQAFIDAGLDLVVSALRVAAGAGDDLGPRRGPLLADLKRDALAGLGDPVLSPAAVARAGYVSARQLHRLFAEGQSFGAWVHEQRLRRCRDDLADAGLGHLAIGEIAERWGYRSAAHFTRAFAVRFGVTPRDFRRTALRTSSPAR